VIVNKDEALLAPLGNNQKNSLNISDLYDHYNKNNTKKFQNLNNTMTLIPNNMNGQTQSMEKHSIKSAGSRHLRAISVIDSNSFNQKQ